MLNLLYLVSNTCLYLPKRSVSDANVLNADDTSLVVLIASSIDGQKVSFTHSRQIEFDVR